MNDTALAPVRRALISVSDKTGVTEFAQALATRGVEILSTGGTCRMLREAGIAVTEVSDYTGFPEMMDGRVKTLHPKIHGGVLGRRGTDDFVMEEHGIAPIDMVVVNLYPFEATVARPDCSLEDAVENIDIGGPTMVRAAAKNHKDVAIVVDLDCVLRLEAVNTLGLNLDSCAVSNRYYTTYSDPVDLYRVTGTGPKVEANLGDCLSDPISPTSSEA